MDDFEKAFKEIKSNKHYNPWILSLAVGFACAGLTLVANGDLINSLTAFVASFIGSFAKYIISKTGIDQVITIGFSAFITTMISGLGVVFQIGTYPEIAMAMAVLYLIPGVPMVNCIIDLIDGFLSSAVNRGVFGAIILLSIAMAMTLCMILLGLSNFR